MWDPCRARIHSLIKVVDADHLPDQEAVRELTSKVLLRWSASVFEDPDRALLMAWALVISGYFFVGSRPKCVIIQSRPSKPAISIIRHQYSYLK